MRERIFSASIGKLFTLAALAFFLSSCTTSRTFATGGSSGESIVAGPLQVLLDPYWPTTIDITHAVVQRPFASQSAVFVISQDQKQEALRSAKQLRELIRTESQTTLPTRLSAIGFRPANAGEKARILKLYIPSVHMRCSVNGNCFTVARIRADLETPDKPKASWFYIGEFGQPATGGEINARLFTSFIDSLMAAMEKDGLLPLRKN